MAAKGKKKLICLFVFLSIFMNCSDKSRNYNYTNYIELKKPDKTIQLQSTVVNKYDLYAPSNIQIIDQYILLIDTKADKIIKVISLKTNELLASFSNLGQGPSEFISASQIIPDQKTNINFWIYDVSTRNLKKYNIDNILNGNSFPEEIMRITSEGSGVPFHIIFADNKIFGTGYFNKGRISIYDEQGKYIRSIGKIPVVLKNERFAAQHSHGFEGNIVIKEKTEEIYLATRLGTIVEKYSIAGELISTFRGPNSYFPEYDIVPVREYYTMTYNKKSRFGYIDICYNKILDRLYLLYSGRYQYGNENERSYMGNTIYVLDKKDTIVENIELDKDIFQMVVSNDGSTIFGLSEKEVLKYEYKKT